MGIRATLLDLMKMWWRTGEGKLTNRCCSKNEKKVFFRAALHFPEERNYPLSPILSYTRERGKRKKYFPLWPRRDVESFSYHRVFSRKKRKKSPLCRLASSEGKRACVSNRKLLFICQPTLCTWVKKRNLHTVSP